MGTLSVVGSSRLPAFLFCEGEMKTPFVSCLFICMTGFIAIVSTGLAQTKSKVHVEIPVVAVKAEDVASPEAIVLADYESISGGVGVARQWGRDHTLYDSHARFVALRQDRKTGAIQQTSSGEQEFADDADGMMVKEGFTEHELAHIVHRYGNVATVLSSYEGKLTSTGKVAARGVNIYQLYFDGKRWWILSVVWDEERPDNPIPPELLPKT
jgi:hypothetical protein